MRSAVALLLLVTGCHPATRTVPLDGMLAERVRIEARSAWLEAGLPDVRLSDVQLVVAADCRSFGLHCPFLRAPGCPGTGVEAVECAPADDLVVVAPRQQAPAWLALHGLMHVASDRLDLHVGPGDPRGTDRRHTDPRIWAQYGPESAEARARSTLVRGED